MNELSTVATLHLAPPVRFEPCVAFHADDAGDPVCVGCGWSFDDHDVEPLAA